MKKIIVMSDTHGSMRGVEKMRALLEENDYLIHLGDGVSESRKLIGDYPEKTYACTGNCDWGSPLPLEGVLSVEKVNIFYCHGHQYGVKSGLARIALEAKRHDCEIVLYGHTHQARIDEIDGVTLINPGSLRAPVGEGGGYCYLVIHGDKATPVLVGESVL
jgi:putative phosphoesterase